MADGPYQFEDDKLPLSADPDLSSGIADFDDHEESAAPYTKPARSKRPLVLGLLLLVVVGGVGAYFAYQMFMPQDEMPSISPRPISVAQQTPSVPLAPMPGTNPAQPGAIAPMPGTTPITAPGAIVPVASGVDNAVLPPMPTVGSPTTPAITPITPTVGPVPATASTIAPVTPSTAAATALPEPIKAEVAPVVNTDVKAVDAAKTDKPKAPEEVTAAMPPKEVTAGETKKAGAKVVPAPSEAQLKPIDPDAVMSKAENKKEGKPLSAMDKKTAATMAAVNEILGSELPSSRAGSAIKTAIKGKEPVQPAPPQEITSRAEQVIKVKRSYSATSSQAINAAGDRVLQDNQYESAIQIYDKQLSNNPSDQAALGGKAVALQKAGRDTEAMDAYQHLVEINPHDLEALTNYLGLLQKQQPEEAMTRLNALSEQYPDNPAVSGQIAAVFASQTDTPNALRYFMKAKALDQTNATYPFNIAVLYDRMGTTPKAIAYYREAISTAQSYPDSSGTIPIDSIRDRLRNISR